MNTRFRVAGWNVAIWLGWLALAPAAWAVNATGGAQTNDVRGYRIHTFTANGTFTVTEAGQVDVLVVAGGGGGGGVIGGGGGAGGMIVTTAHAVAAGPIAVTVGMGGAGGIGLNRGLNGTNSAFDAIVAFGGGGGGGWNYQAGNPGGSGGGQSGNGSTAAAAGTNGQGYAGGVSSNNANGGSGGGGAGGPGTNGIAAQAGRGGVGAPCGFSGATLYYAGGGGGGAKIGTGKAGAGGAGGGGSGSASGVGSNAVPNTGGGGGGGAGTATHYAGGSGGSGIVIVRYWIGGPVISNVSAVVEVSGVTLNGYLVSAGSDPNVSATVFWGTNDAGGDLTGWTYTNVFPGWSSVGPLSATVYPTAAGARHYYRFYATNSFHHFWAEPTGEFTAFGAPAVNNEAGAVKVSHETAVLRGEATAGQPRPEVWIYWGTVNQGTDRLLWEHEIPVGTASNWTFSAPANGLAFGQLYYYTCYASNSYGTAWSAVKTFSGNDGTVHFVDVDGATPESPYLNWANAATSIQDAVDACAPSDTVWVADGTYLITNEIVLAKPITLQSVWGASSTIVARAASGTNEPYHRIFQITDNATLDGFTVQNGYFYGNTNGAGILMTKGTVQNCIIYTNTLRGVWGGTRIGCGVYMTGGTLRHCTIVSNSSDYYSLGGGVAQYGGTVQSNVFRYNGASAGGGVATAAGYLLDCLIEWNTGYGAGIGGLGNYPSTTISNCLIRYNKGVQGGGFSMPDLNVMVDCVIVSNEATSFGGGIYSGMNYNTVNFSRCKVGWNKAPTGAGVYLDMGNASAYGAYNFENCLIVDNIGPHAVYMTGGRNWARFRNCTIAAFQPYGVFTPGPFSTNLYSGNAVVYPLFQNTILYNFQTNIFSTNSTLLSILLTNSFTNSCSPQLTEPGLGNVSADPRFEKAAEGKYKLMKNSPCAGSGTTNVLSLYKFDLENVAWGDAVNMGCYKTLIPAQGTILLIR